MGFRDGSFLQDMVENIARAHSIELNRIDHAFSGLTAVAGEPMAVCYYNRILFPPPRLPRIRVTLDNEDP